MWRRAEEARWKATLKDKETEHLGHVAREWQERENARERQFQSTISSLAQLESKLRSKALDLQKREQKILALEDELRQKLNDTARQLAIKEEEVSAAKTRLQELKLANSKENKAFETKVASLRGELSKTEQELSKLRREQDSEQLQLLRNELNAKHYENLENSTKIEQLLAAKNLFKRECERLKDELVRVLRAHEEEKQKWMDREREELNRMRLEIDSKKFHSEEAAELKELRTHLTLLQGRVATNKQPATPPQRTEEPKNSEPSPQRLNRIEGPIPQTVQFYSGTAEMGNENELNRLKRERSELLGSGVYNEDDLLIQELDRQIAVLCNE